MSSENDFTCIFCNERFSDKIEFQLHFRKHGDPEFNSKKRHNSSNDENQTESSKEALEMVDCDVCSEVFTSISKAITHKHKLHPDHAGKYFCPWCGKLFTMKYLYSKHLSKNHIDCEKTNDKYFHCDVCDVDFNIPTAMIYHNKFFHRQDSDLPAIGNSKKLKVFEQEAVMIYYCPFCGEEYENKVNLHKHVTDEHSDENQSPDNLFRCPLCEAVFYHLDAYELHLMHHSVDDLYSERNEMVDNVTDFSFESVPPIPETVENMQPESTQEVESVMGIDQLLQLANDETKIKKHKKHKKHKKSKKPTITLDEFLNMNKDVFGEEINVQGIEEVPTRSVTKKLKSSKKTPAKNVSPDIEKLKKQGIVVKTKLGSVGKRIMKAKVVSKPAVNIEKTSNTPDEVVSKILKLPNSQIKIVKKSGIDLKSKEQEIPREDNDDKVMDDNPTDVPSTSTSTIEEKGNVSKEQDNNGIETNNAANTLNNTNSNLKEMENNSESPIHEEESILNKSDYVIDKVTNINDTLNALKSNKNIVMKQNTIIGENTEQNMSDKSNSEDESYEKLVEKSTNDKSKTLQALKNLSHLTVKSNKAQVSPVTNTTEIAKKQIIKNIEHEKNGGENSPVPENENHECQEDELNNESETTNKMNSLKSRTLKVKKIKPQMSKESIKNNPPPSDLKQQNDLLKNLKNITAKPLNSTKTANTSVRPKITEKNVNLKNEFKAPLTPMSNQTTGDIEIFNIDDSDDEEVNHPNVIEKSDTPSQNENSNKSLDTLKSLSQNLTIKQLKTNEKTVERKIKTEDDYDDEEFSDNPPVSKVQTIDNNKQGLKKNIVKNVLKNLGKNITVKSKTFPTQVKVQLEEFSTEDHDFPEEDSDTEAQLDRVQIKDVTNMSDDEFNEELDEQNPKVDHPDEDFNSENEDHEFDEAINDPTSDTDFDESINAHTLHTINKANSTSNQNLNTLKKIGKGITIKSSAHSNKNVNSSDDVPQIAKTLSQQICNKSLNQNRSRIQTLSANQQNTSSTSSNQVNTKEVKTVKTFKRQTETVIEEVTTTVTKTIKTINQTNQVVRNQTGQCSIIRPKVLGMNPSRPQQNYQGVKVRQASIPTSVSRPRIRNPVSQATRPTFNARSQNQIVSVRPALMSSQVQNPRIQNTVKPPQSSPQNQIRKPVKISPGVANALTKRQNNEETSHFSCFKKPKESLIPIPDVPISKSNDRESVQFSSMQMSKSNYSCTTKSIKGNSVVTSSQVKSEMSASSQQLSKLRNMSGLSVVRTNQVKQCNVEEKSENVASTTLQAIQKLQSQGLLVKKPRISVAEESEHSNPDSDGEHFSNEEFDE